MNIYASAQLFGFGPVSNLFTLLKALKKQDRHIKIFLIENEATKIFNKKNPGVADCMVPDIDPGNCELIISSFDPFAVVTGWINEIPTVYYCNLFWYWGVHEKFDKIKKNKADLEFIKKQGEKKVFESFNSLFRANSHEAIFMGYQLADTAITRKFPNIEQLKEIYRKDINLVESEILIIESACRSFSSKKTVLIQLAGSRNPVVSSCENNLYLKFCINFSLELARIFKDLEFITCVNPHVLNEFSIDIEKNLPENFKLTESMSQEDNISLMADSLAIFSSPGLETIYEAIFTGSPVFILPEQNAGQYPIIKMLQSAGIYFEGFLINEIFPDREVLKGEADAHSIYKLMEKHMLSLESMYFKALVQNACNFIERYKDILNRERFRVDCYNKLQKYMGEHPFGAANKISELISRKYFT